MELSEHVLREYYLPAYKDCIDAGVRMLMPSFNTLNGIPSVANPWLMQTVLKDEWGFEGVVISDYDAVGELITHGVAKDQKEAAKRLHYNKKIPCPSDKGFFYANFLRDSMTFPKICTPCASAPQKRRAG